MHVIWSGVIGFGLVNIPVRMVSPAKEEQLDLDLLHKKDRSPVRYARVCREEEKEIEWSEIERGFKIGGRYVVLTDADFEKANVRKSRTIDIRHFADLEEIDPLFFEKPYYLEPEARAKKPYALLRQALEETGKVGVATFVMRHREHLAVVKPYKNVLVLNQMRFPRAVASTDKIDAPALKSSAKELKIAKDIIAKTTETFRPMRYRDRYLNELKDIIRQKARGKSPKARGKAPRPTRSNDLLRELKRTLAQRRRESVR